MGGNITKSKGRGRSRTEVGMHGRDVTGEREAAQ
jgi:hypothetical protein